MVGKQERGLLEMRANKTESGKKKESIHLEISSCILLFMFMF